MSGHKPELCPRVGCGNVALTSGCWRSRGHTVTRGCLGFDFGSVMIEKQPVMGSDLKPPNANNWQRRTRRLPLTVQHVTFTRDRLTEISSRQTTEPRGHGAAL